MAADESVLFFKVITYSLYVFDWIWFYVAATQGIILSDARVQNVSWNGDCTVSGQNRTALN